MNFPQIMICHDKDPPIVESLSEGNRWLIGRCKSCNFRIEDPEVSRKHCTIIKISNSLGINYKIVDGLLGKSSGSSFGLWKDGKKLSACFLKHGDVFQLSSKSFVSFLWEDQERNNNDSDKATLY